MPMAWASVSGKPKNVCRRREVPPERVGCAMVRFCCGQPCSDEEALEEPLELAVRHGSGGPLALGQELTVHEPDVRDEERRCILALVCELLEEDSQRAEEVEALADPTGGCPAKARSGPLDAALAAGAFAVDEAVRNGCDGGALGVPPA